MQAGEKIILTGGKIILAGKKIILAGRKIILAGGKISQAMPVKGRLQPSEDDDDLSGEFHAAQSQSLGPRQWRCRLEVGHQILDVGIYFDDYEHWARKSS